MTGNDAGITEKAVNQAVIAGGTVEEDQRLARDILNPRLTGAAGLSVLAHMEDLVARRVVETDGAPAIDGAYRLAA